MYFLFIIHHFLLWEKWLFSYLLFIYIKFFFISNFLKFSSKHSHMNERPWLNIQKVGLDPNILLGTCSSHHHHTKRIHKLPHKLHKNSIQAHCNYKTLQANAELHKHNRLENSVQSSRDNFPYRHHRTICSYDLDRRYNQCSLSKKWFEEHRTRTNRKSIRVCFSGHCNLLDNKKVFWG